MPCVAKLVSITVNTVVNVTVAIALNVVVVAVVVVVGRLRVACLFEG